MTDATNGSCEGLEDLAGELAAKAEDDPAHAADLVTTLGPDGIDDLFDAPFGSSVGSCAGPLFYAAGLMPQLLGAATWSDRLSDETLDVLLSPDNQHLAGLLSPTVTLAPRAKARVTSTCWSTTPTTPPGPTCSRSSAPTPTSPSATP